MRAIITHENADLDALSSLVAAELLYDDAVCLRSGHLSSYVKRYLALHKDQRDLRRIHDIDPAEVDHVVVVDVRKAGRLKEFRPLFEGDAHVTIWDHHPASPDDIEGDEVTVEPVGACTTLLCERLREEGTEPGEEDATLMLLGIYADTGRLSFDSTTPRDVEAAAWLLRHGASLPVVNRYLQEQFSLAQQKLLAEMMFSIEEISVGGADVLIATGAAEDFVKGTADVIEHILNLGGHEAVFGVVDFKGGKRVQVIGRSRVPYIDVGSLLEGLGGGGHAGAGGAARKKTTTDAVVEELKEILTDSDINPCRVRDLMSSPIETIDRDLSLERAGELLERWGVTGAPVVQDGQLEGVISHRDIDDAREAGRLDLPVSGHMSHNPITIPGEESLEDALELMTDNDIGRLPVLEDGRLTGIITRSDVLRHLYSEG